jgi:hypothetical protein
MFGWFSTTMFFKEISDIDMKSMLYSEKIKQIEDDLLPFGVINDNTGMNMPDIPQWEVWKG